MDRTFPFSRAALWLGLALTMGFRAQARETWAVESRTDPASVHVSKTAMDGRTVFRGGCNTLLGPGLTGTVISCRGNALQRIDDRSEPVTFDITGKFGREQFAGQVHYVAAEEAWVITGLLPPAVISAMGRGERLDIRNGRGEVAVSFDLHGAARAAKTMRRGCGLTATPTGGSQEPEAVRRPGKDASPEFVEQCIACLNEAHELGRSVGGFCPGDCVQVFETMVCDSQGLNCRPGP